MPRNRQVKCQNGRISTHSFKVGNIIFSVIKQNNKATQWASYMGTHSTQRLFQKLCSIIMLEHLVLVSKLALQGNKILESIANDKKLNPRWQNWENDWIELKWIHPNSNGLFNIQCVYVGIPYITGTYIGHHEENSLEIIVILPSTTCSWIIFFNTLISYFNNLSLKSKGNYSWITKV